MLIRKHVANRVKLQVISFEILRYRISIPVLTAEEDEEKRAMEEVEISIFEHRRSEITYAIW